MLWRVVLSKSLLPVLCLVFAASVSAQNPQNGSLAPALTFNHVLQAPAGTKADLPSLKGQVVVLEFWATWCVPCINQIPAFNALQASVDPSRVQFISVDDEDPALVEKFLQRKPISGWLGFDTTGKTFERYNVESRPVTIVLDTKGRIASNSLLNDVRPEDIKPEQLLALASGKAVVFVKDKPAGGAASQGLKGNH
jgi:thiol-disulfide isomerase/thioredoxin